MIAATGSALAQGAWWSARARDWADLQEGQCRRLFEAALDAVRAGPGLALLDAGCGSGMACGLAAARGAAVSGLDAAEALIAIAKERVPGGEFRVGELEELPYADQSFDVVCGFNAFQYAARPEQALREGGRVARPGGTVVVATWGRAVDCEAARYLAALRGLIPPPPPDAPGPVALSDDGRLEALAEEAGLEPLEIRTVECLWSYPDLETALKGLLSAGPAVRAIQTSGEESVRAAVTEAIRPFRCVSGAYCLENQFRYLMARA